ncbi:MAG: chorismate mutase, partial [Elusimicrobia bacterium]|nr:chorismate mutase [Elusimicrobiota bacterium]
DEIDAKIVDLFAARMDVAAEIAAFKKERGLPVLDPKREREKLIAVRSQAPEAYGEYTAHIFCTGTRFKKVVLFVYQKKIFSSVVIFRNGKLFFF